MAIQYQPRMAVKTNLAMAKISGSTADAENRFPGGDVEFSRTIYDLGAQFECNFLPMAAVHRTKEPAAWCHISLPVLE